MSQRGTVEKLKTTKVDILRSVFGQHGILVVVHMQIRSALCRLYPTQAMTDGNHGTLSQVVEHVLQNDRFLVAGLKVRANPPEREAKLDKTYVDEIAKLTPHAQIALYRSILDGISDGIIVASNDFMFINSAARRITGVSETSFPADKWSTVFGCFHESGVPYLTESLPLIRAMRGESVDCEEMLLDNEYLQKPVWIEISARPLSELSDLGNLGVVVFRDITERKVMREQLEKNNIELEHFAYIAAHDLQEPLRTVISYLDLLSDRYAEKIDDKATKYIRNAVSGASRMQRLIRALLTYSRVSAKTLSLSAVDMNTVVFEVLAALETSISECQAKIECEQLPTLTADKTQLCQVLQNLISNALKYRHGAPIIRISAKGTAASWTFCVEDSGIGFDQKSAERIFLIFQRLHSRSEYEGTGIGLALCRRIVELHGGRIWAESEVGHGSKFFFTIPK